MPRSTHSSRSRRSYTESEILRMKILNFLDDVGNFLICRPLLYLAQFKYANFFDDIGISLVIRPLRWLYRFAEFLVELTEWV